MTDTKKIAEALRRCSTRPGTCRDCPYFDLGFPYSCEDKLMREAAEIIEKMTEEMP